MRNVRFLQHTTIALLSALALAGCSGGSAKTAKKEQLVPRLAKLTTTSASSIRGETLLEPKAVAAFYEARHAEPAWDLPGDATAVRKAIAEVAKDGLDPADYHLALIDTLLAERAAARTDELDTDLELVLSDAVASVVDHLRYGRVRPKSLNPSWNIDPREGATPLETEIAHVAATANPGEGIESEKLDHFIYRGLKDELARLTEVARAGGWPTIPAGKTIAPGTTDARIPAVRARLLSTGELAAATGLANPDSLAYDDALQMAVQMFQARHRLDADGQLDPSTIAALAVPVEQRIGQVRVNLERSRWVLPRHKVGTDLMLVNLPAFKAYLIRGGKNVWETKTQIGKEARQTPSFRSDLKFVIFNPTWTVPRTILAEDVLPGMSKGQNTIAKKHLRIFDSKGNEVSPGSIDWKSATPSNFPYTLRQDAGEDNALGRIKFMFPNKYDVYLHDTPHRELFEAERRTFSSGCIRVADPIGLAVQLLGDQGYDEAKVKARIAAGDTKQVNLTKPLPIVIVYWTVSVGESGEVRYGPDVYDLDAPLLRALDEPLASRSARL